VDQSKDEIKEAIVAAAKDLDAVGLVLHSSGNVSARYGENVFITASGVPYSRMTTEHVIEVDMEGNPLEGELMPSIEKGMHLGLFQARQDVQAVIHSHPVFATAFAAARKPIPAFLDEMAVYVGGTVEVCEWALSGSHDLAEAAVETVGQKAAALLANHGMIACGVDIEEALHVTKLVERAAITRLWTNFLGGAVDTPAEMTTMFEQVYRYKHGLT